MVLTKRTSNLPLICQICGDIARGINFDVMTCMSCKAFFRRHALQPRNHLHCLLENNCEITQLTRGACSACRLKKCFLVGMNPKLIRCISLNHCRPSKRKARLLPQPLPLNLLEKDSSTLTTYEWNLLSNVLHAYDQGNSILHTKYMLEQQSLLPPKLRTKSTTILDIIGFHYSTILAFFDRMAFFRDLPADSRRALVQRNADTTGTYNSIFIIRESNALDNSAFAVGSSNVYGYENFLELKKYLSQLEHNGVLIKIMFSIFAFSGNCSIVIPDYKENLETISNTISFMNIQNVLVTMLWKYLNYQYGFGGAVRCFNSFIKFILNILRWTAEKYVDQHWNMVETIVESTSRSLTIDG